MAFTGKLDAGGAQHDSAGDVDVLIASFDRDGKPFDLRLTDFAARVAQHEADHLDGVLFFDRMTSMESLTFMDEYSRYHQKDED